MIVRHEIKRAVTVPFGIIVEDLIGGGNEGAVDEVDEARDTFDEAAYGG